jgi:hypothetical protein
MERVERIKTLLAKREEIDRELEGIRQQAREENAAFAINRKPRKKRQGDLPLAAE